MGLVIVVGAAVLIAWWSASAVRDQPVPILLAWCVTAAGIACAMISKTKMDHAFDGVVAHHSVVASRIASAMAWQVIAFACVVGAALCVGIATWTARPQLPRARVIR
ncbi:MAG: hypothetical protein QM831_00270 [Kofleriaceae bacterium]